MGLQLARVVSFRATQAPLSPNVIKSRKQATYLHNLLYTEQRLTTSLFDFTMQVLSFCALLTPIVQ